MLDLDKLCNPAHFYFVVSIISFLIVVGQNLMEKNNKKFCLGNFDCDTNHKWNVIFFQLLYLIFWTYILDKICKKGWTTISWLLVLMPYILTFILLGLFIIHEN